MMHAALKLLVLGLMVVLAAPVQAQKTAPADAKPTPASADPRALLRAQVEDELALLRPRLKRLEDDAKEQADRYRDMAASKAEAGKKAAEKAEKARTRADEAQAKQGYKPKPPGPAGAGGKKGADPKAGAGGAGSGAAGGAGGGESAKKVDPVLTQHYVVLSMRDQIRQLRDRIAYLEELRAKLAARS